MGQAFYSAQRLKNIVREMRSEADRHDLQPHHLANGLIEACRQRHDLEGMKFWRGVWIELMTDDYLRTQPKAPGAKKNRLQADRLER
ncbi:MAG TPA: hypothetical protein VL625_10805 [Patescibacteria group bacterium]|jgi:hypothetical protein|nr:hypothetical protein [Patescibacteria group bacterium]